MKRLRILEVLGVLVLLGWTGLAHATLVSRIDGFFSPDDGLLHAIVGTSDKKVYDVTWTDGSAPTITLLHQFNTSNSCYRSFNITYIKLFIIILDKTALLFIIFM